MRRIYLFALLIVGVVSFSNGQASIATLSLDNITARHTQQNTLLYCDTVITLDYQSAITGLSVSGVATLHHNSNSLVRITLQDDYDTEYLVYELYPLLADSNIVYFDNVAFETMILDNVKAEQLNIKILNATLQLDAINTSTNAVRNYAARQSSMLESQSTYIIGKLNANLEKNNMTWRAGETSISQLTYEEKKAMFGGEVPNLGGFEYYVGGVFVMPNYDYTTTTNIAPALVEDNHSTSYVSEWDWRNRHGKNWMTSVKSQGNCGSCWAFSTLGAVEAYINLYYNQLLDVDLSEQELICDMNNLCDGGNPVFALDYITNHGVMDENSYPYVGYSENCDDKPTTFSDLVRIEQFTLCDSIKYSEIYLKQLLFKSPIIMGISSWKHGMTLVGYREIQNGDNIYIKTTNTTIEFGDSLIGKTVWIFKNSHGISSGDMGYVYLMADPSDIAITTNYSLRGKVWSLTHSDEDIVVEDEDGDGYYFWGIGERPQFTPTWAQSEPDGDDSNPAYGPIDKFGFLKPITTDSFPNVIIDSTVVWNNDNYLYNDVRVVDGGKLTISANIMKYPTSTIFVESGGELVVDEGSIVRGCIVVSSSAKLSLIDGGKILLEEPNFFKMEEGGVLDIKSGYLEIIN